MVSALRMYYAGQFVRTIPLSTHQEKCRYSKMKRFDVQIIICCLKRILQLFIWTACCVTVQLSYESAYG